MRPKNRNKKNKTVSAKLNMESLISIIHEFSGDPDEINFFKEQVSEAKSVNNLSDEAALMLMKAKLSGNARKFFASSPKAKSVKNINDAFKILTDFFCVDYSKTSQLIKFDSLTLLPGETINSLAHRVEVQTIKTYDKTENIEALEQVKIIAFMNALPKQLKCKLIEEDYKSFENVVKRANKLVLINEAINLIDDRKNLEQVNHLEIAIANKIDKLEQKLTDLTLKVQENKQTYSEKCNAINEIQENRAIAQNYRQPQVNKVETIRCNFYQKPNHIMTNCWHYLNSQQQTQQYNRFPYRNQQYNVRPAYYQNNRFQNRNHGYNYRMPNRSNAFMHNEHSFRPGNNISNAQSLNLGRGG